MASPYVLTNSDLQMLNVAGQSFRVYAAFMNPVSITTNWSSLNQDSQGNWMPPPNFDTAANHKQPYAPICNLGPNRIGFVGEPLYFDGGRSSQRYDVPVMSYIWSVIGPSTKQLYDNGSQIAVTWTSAGLYTISLTVKDRAGTAITGTRQVMVYQDRFSTLPGVISISGLSGSLSSGGWQCQITTTNSQITLLNPDAMPVGQYLPIVIMAETAFEVAPNVWSQRTIGPHGMFNPGYPYIDPRIFFDGYVQNGSVHMDVDKATLSFTCAGPQMILQETKSVQLGYYNCQYTSVLNNVPAGCKPSPVGQGYQVGFLNSIDVVYSLLQDHCNIAKYHDIHAWIPAIPAVPYTTSKAMAYYIQTYTTLSVNEGSIWQCIGDLVGNEWAQCYCGRDGGIRIGPQVNYRGQDFWAQPTLLGGASAPFLMNLVSDLGFTVAGSPSQVPANMPTLPALPMPVTFVHPWGHQQNPPQFLRPFGEVNTQIQQTQQNLLGPPILCTFSDVPVYDQANVPPDSSILYPWIVANWPQDLAIYPVSFDFNENYSGHTSLVKLIFTLYGHTTLWTSWYPTSAFSPTGDGTVSIVQSTLPASNWVVDSSHLLPDVTTNQFKQLIWNYIWEMAARHYCAQNTKYTGTVTLGIFTACSLGDIVSVTQQTNNVGPHFANKLFYVQEIDYALDLTARTWQTVLTLGEVTSTNVGPLINPPTTVPNG
jgi:hypothetical protein